LQELTRSKRIGTVCLIALIPTVLSTLPLLQGAQGHAQSIESAPASAANTADWPTYSHDPARSGNNPAEKTLSPSNVSSLVVRWSLKTRQPIEASASVSSGTVYVGAWDGYEYALDQATGHVKWKTFLGQTSTPKGFVGCNHPFPDTAGISSSASIENGTVYVAGGDSYFYALDAASGKVLWKTFLVNTNGTGYYTYASPVLAQGFAYLGLSSYGNCPSVPGAAIQIDLTSHQVVSKFFTVTKGAGGAIWSSPAYDLADNTVYFSDGEPIATSDTRYTDAILAFRASDMSLLHYWSIPHDASFFADADFGAGPTLFTDHSGRKLLGDSNKNGHFYALDRSTFHVVWERKVGDQPGDDPMIGRGSISPAAFANGTLYVAGGHTVINRASCAGSLRAIDPSSGKYIWEYCEPGVVIGAVAYANGMVIVGAGKTLEVHSATTGALLYAYQESTDPKVMLTAAPTIVNGQILEGSSDGTFFALGLPTSPNAVLLRPTYVQGNFVCPQASLSTVEVGYANPQLAGNINILAIGWNDVKTTISSVSDSAGNTYRVAVPTMRANGMSQAIYYAKNIVRSGTNTVTVTFNGRALHADIRIMEYMNVDRSDPFSTSSTATGGAGPAVSGAAWTTTAPQLLVAAGMTQQSFSGAGEDYALRMLTVPDADIVEDKVVSTIGASEAVGELNGNWLMQLATFRGVQKLSKPAIAAAPAAAAVPVASATAAPATPTPTPAGSTVASPTAPVSSAVLAAGKAAFNTASCGLCHTLSSVQGAIGTRGPSLDGIGKIRSADWLLVQIKNPCAPGHANAAAGYSCAAMPANLASGKQAEDLAAFLAAQN
jgi:outer membrane protein assembly factor BamB